MIRRRPRSTLFPSPTLFRAPSGPFESKARLALLPPPPPPPPPPGLPPRLRPRWRFIPLKSLMLLLTSAAAGAKARSEEHTSELQSRQHLVCRLLLEIKKIYS